jgi:hypothetical protein
MTFVWFTPTTCNKAELVEVNIFNKSSQTWKTNRFGMKKFENFYGCPWVIGIENAMPMTGFKVYGNNTVELYGTFVKMFSELAKIFNLTVEFNDESRELGNPINKTSVKNLTVDQMIYIHELNWWSLGYFYDNVIYQPYGFQEQFIAVPPGELFSPYEKLVLPFDEATWFLIILVFVAAFTTIFVAYFMSQSYREIIFGENVDTPSINVTAHFFGISQNLLPSKYFARVIVMIFILYSLIIRTAYQGKMFEFLQRDMRKSQVKTVDELIEKKFAFHLWAPFFDVFHDNELFKRFV